MTREGHSCSHKSPSYKVHNHPHMRRHIYTYIMHNTTEWESKSDIAIRYKKCKTDIAILRERNPSKEQENKMGYMEEDPNTCSKEEA